MFGGKSSQTTEETEIEKSVTQGGPGERMGHTWRGYWTGRARRQIEKKVRSGAHAHIRVCGWSALGFLGHR